MEEKKTVLIVEDEKSIVDIVRFNLEKEGYAVLTAYDGEAGLRTARSGSPDLIQILGLEIGADDYITKPFSMRELMARVKANIRRTVMQQPQENAAAVPAAGGLTIDPENYQVSKHGKPISLTQREYELLTFLAGHPGKVYSRTDLMEQVWNYDYVGEDVRTVDVTVRRLREKIEDDPANPALILTRRGVGYYFSGQ